MRPAILLISGSMGAGKTTVMGEASDLLADAGIGHATLDFDCLGQMHPAESDDSGAGLAFRNLKAIWPNYEAAGVRRMLIAAAVEDKAELTEYRAAIPNAKITVCRLLAPTATLHDRLRVREPGIWQARFLARATELDGILDDARVEDFVVDNGPGRDITEAATEVLRKAGW